MGKDGREGEDGRQAHLGDYHVETAGLESGRQAALEIVLEDIVLKVTSMIESLSIEIA